jgi:hypothetical protein
MNTPRATLAIWLILAGPLTAAPPTLTTLTPHGAERGKEVEITLTGTNLTADARLMLPFKATQASIVEAKPNPARARLKLTVDAATPLGIYPIRVRTAEGITGLQFFSVEAFPGMAEVEDNSAFEKAQKIKAPIVVEGTCAGGDVDFFRFPATKGQRLVIEVLSARLGSGVLPQLRLTDDRQRLLAADDSQSLQGDGRLIVTIPTDGDYVVELSDSRYRGGNPAHYRLQIAEYDVAEEVFPLGGRRGARVDFRLLGGTLANEVRLPRTPDAGVLPLDGAVRIGMMSPRLAVGDYPEIIWDRTKARDPRGRDLLPPVTVNSRLEKPGARDVFQVAVEPGNRYRFTVQAESLGSRLDGVLTIRDANGKQLAVADDVDLPSSIPGQPPTRTVDPSLDFTVPEGVRLLQIELRDQRKRGGLNFGYRLTVEPAVADFTIGQPVTELNVPRGGTAVLTVPVTRRGYTGALQLTAKDLPAGVTASGGHVPAGATNGVLILSAAENATAEGGFVMLEGTSVGATTEVRARGEMHLVVSREANPGASMLVLSHFALGVSGAEPFAIRGPVAPVEAVIGYPTTVTATVTRAKDQAALAIDVTGLDPRAVAVPGRPPVASAFTLKPSGPNGAASTTFTLTPLATALEGPQDLVIQGKAKVGPADRVVTGSALVVNVRPPFAVEPVAPTLTLTPGQTVSLKAKLVRQAVFKETVQLRLTGLPPGVTLAAPLAPVPGDRAEIDIHLKVDAKAATANATLALACTTTISGMVYNHPPVTIAAQLKK